MYHKMPKLVIVPHKKEVHSTSSDNPSEINLVGLDDSDVLPKLETIKATSGVYFLNHPFYPNHTKIGCSIDIGRRIKDGDYRTMFKPEDTPKLLGYFTRDNFESKEEVLYLERCTHKRFKHTRCNPNRELFDMNITQSNNLEMLKNFLYNLCNDDYQL